MSGAPRATRGAQVPRHTARRARSRRTARIARRRLRSYDGTPLAYYTAGDPAGVPMVLCGGLGGGIDIWRPVLARFGDRFRLLTWDYRGLYASGRARDPRAYSLAHHVRDLVHLLEHEGLESPVLLGWSMGVQLGLEVHRTHPELLRGLVAIHGTHGNPLATAFDSSLSARVAPYVLALLRLVGPRFALVGPRLARSDLVYYSFLWSVQRLGLMAPSLDRVVFRDLAEAWTRLDLATYAEIFAHLAAHDASDLLESIRTPTLVIAGDRDRFTPHQLGRCMAERIPDATLEVVPGATHFGLLEFPERILDRVERFARERLRILL